MTRLIHRLVHNEVIVPNVDLVHNEVIVLRYLMLTNMVS
jgi:hypothetical protein